MAFPQRRRRIDRGLTADGHLQPDPGRRSRRTREGPGRGHRLAARRRSMAPSAHLSPARIPWKPPQPPSPAGRRDQTGRSSWLWGRGEGEESARGEEESAHGEEEREGSRRMSGKCSADFSRRSHGVRIFYFLALFLNVSHK